MTVETAVRLKGRFRMEVRDGQTMELTKPPLEFDNLILDNGLETAGTGEELLRACQVGSSNTAPNISQTGLLSYIAGTTDRADINGPTPQPPEYVYTVGRRFRFGIGAAAGNLSEVGVGWGASGATLFSRALITDEEGNPTTVTVLPTEVLDVYYYLDVYPDTQDQVFSISDGTDIHDCIFRWANITTWTSSDVHSGFLGSYNISQILGSIYSQATLGSITGVPTGGSSQPINSPTITARSWAPYSANSRYRDFICEINLDAGNYASGINAIYIRIPRSAGIQCSFSPPIMKKPNQVLRFVLRVKWARHVP